MIKIALIDDHRIVRCGIKKILEPYKDIIVCMEASNGAVFFRNLVPDNIPNIIILDINMPEMNGFETLTQLKCKYPDIKTIVFSMVKGKDAVVHILNAGACGCLSKDEDPEELVAAIRNVSENGRYVRNVKNSAICGQRKTVKIREGFNGVEHLSIREIEVIKLFATELSYSQIGKRLNLEAKTVENYRDRLFIKLGICNRNSLTIFAIQNGLYNPY